MHELAETGDESLLPEALMLARAQFEAQPTLEHRIQYGQLLIAEYAAAAGPSRGRSVLDEAFEAIVTGAADQVDPAESLGIRLPAVSRTGIASLDLAISVLGQADSEPHPLQAAALAQALRIRYQEADDYSSLRRAAVLHEWLLGRAPNDPGLQHAVADDLLALDPWSHDAAALGRAVELAGNAAGTELDLDFDTRALYTVTLANAFLARYDRSFALEDLDAAQYTSASLAEALGEDHPFTALCANLLGEALIRRYRRLGRSWDLHAGIVSLRAAAEFEDVPKHQADLANALRLRWVSEGDDHARLEAYHATERCGGLTTVADADAHLALYAHGCSLLAAHEAGTDDLKFATSAIVFLRLALGRLPPEHPSKAQYVGRLADAWQAKFVATEDARDLAVAVQSATTALKLTGPDHPDRARQLARCAHGLVDAFEVAENTELLWRAFQLLMEALEYLPEDDPYRYEVLYYMGSTTQQLAERLNDDELFAGALSMLRRAVLPDVAPPRIQLEASLAWGALAAARESWNDAAVAYLRAIAALRELVGTQLSRDVQESRAAQFSGVAADAAAASLRANGDPDAVLWLEVGRGILLGHQLDLTAQQRLLAAGGSPEEAARMAELIREQQEAAAQLDEVQEPGRYLPIKANRAAHRLREASEQLDSLFAEQREHSVEGLGRVFSVEQLISAAAEGPLVWVNINRYRSDAVIARPSGLTVVPLTHPQCTPDVVTRLLDELTAAYQAEPSLSARRARRSTVSKISAWLWTVVVAPVLDELGYAPVPGEDVPRPRIWWLPSGPLALLPLHAAGLPDGPHALDAVVSSYTPTVRTLNDARRPGPDTRIQATVGIQHTEGQHELKQAVAEAVAVQAGYRGQTLINADATADRVLTALADATWVHLACHGLVNQDSPSQSGLVLHDRILTVSELARTRFEQGTLAYLSACSTARTNAEHADEAIHPTSAFQVAGFRHVIGTLWPVDDSFAAETASLFYNALGDDAPRTAEVLHSVTRHQRRTYPDEPENWATLVHNGA